MIYTVLGASGFIGAKIAQKLKLEGHDVITPVRSRNSKEYLDQIIDINLGNVIYAVGLTADFREKPFDTVEAHICLIKDILKYANFSNLVYLSSTRVYQKNKSTIEREDISLPSFESLL